MHIVKKWLRKYSPKAHISKGEQEIIGVRYFTENDPPKKEFLYIGLNRDFIETDRRGVICANSGDLILLETEDLYEVFNEMQEMLEFYNNWEMETLRLIEENASVSQILSRSSEMLGYGLVLTDASHYRLGDGGIRPSHEKYLLPDGRLSDDTVRDINQVLKEHVLDCLPYQGYLGEELDLVRNFFDGEVVIGWLVVLDIESEPEQEALSQLTESFSRLLEFWFRINRDSLRLSDQSSIFSEILEGKETDPEVMRARLSGIGWFDTPLLQLARVQLPKENLFHRTYLERTIPSFFSKSFAFRFREELFLISNLSLQKDGAETFKRELREMAARYGAVVGLSYPFTDIQNLYSYYEQTGIALSGGVLEKGKVYACEDCAMAYLKSVIRQNMQTDVAHRALDALKAYDKQRGTEYYQTLGAYLLLACDQTQTAQQLHIHRNSLIYRVNKIQEVLQLDLADANLRLYLLLSYFIRDTEFGI